MNSNDLLNGVSAYKRLLNISYYFVTGRKNQLIEIRLNFSEREFFHLAGLQYIKDLPELNKDREKYSGNSRVTPTFRIKSPTAIIMQISKK